MFGVTNKMLIVLLTSIVNVSNHTKCLSFGNQKGKTHSTVINLHPNGYSQEFQSSSSIHLWLNHIDELEVVIFLLTYLITYVFQIKHKI